MFLLWNSLDPEVLQPSEKKRRHHCILQDVGAILFTRSSSVPFQNVWNCRIPVEILSDYENVVTSSQDHYTMWVKADPDEAAVRRQESSTREHFFDTNRSSVQKRLSIYNWNPRGKGVLLRNELQESGILSPYRRRLIMWTMNSSQTGSMLPTTEVAQCCSTRILSSLTSRSSPVTSTIPGANCLIR